MTRELELCDPECEGVVLPMLEAAGDTPRRNPGPTVPGVRTDPGAYMDLAECEELVQATLAHLAEYWARVMAEQLAKKNEFAARAIEKRLAAIGTVRPVVAWSPGHTIKRQGVCKYERLPTGEAVGFRIEFSPRVFERVDVSVRVQTVIHEASHAATALLGGSGHDRTWEQCMRACGVPADVYANHVEGVGPEAICPKCSTAAGLTMPQAIKLQAGKIRGICRKCGTFLTAESVVIPEHLAKRAESTRRRVTAPPAAPAVAVCPSCGTRAGIPPRFLKRFKAGLSQLRCPGCHRVLTAEVLGLREPLEGLQQNPSSTHTIREDQGDGFRIDTDAGFIQYRPTEDGNEVWWIESRRRGEGAKLMALMLEHHPAEAITWGATSEAGQAFRERWHAVHPEVIDATGGEREPFEGQYDPY